MRVADGEATVLAYGDGAAFTEVVQGLVDPHERHPPAPPGQSASGYYSRSREASRGLLYTVPGQSGVDGAGSNAKVGAGSWEPSIRCGLPGHEDARLNGEDPLAHWGR